MKKPQKTFHHLIALMISVLSFAQTKEDIKPTVWPINQAIEKGFLELKITGASNPLLFDEVIDRDGVHFGKCMAIVLKSKIDSLILLKIDCGTALIPFDTTFQKMIVTKTVELPLYPNHTYATRFYAMCGQIDYDPPYNESFYQVGQLADSTTVKLAKYLEENFIQNMIGQHALWAYTDQADFYELEKYGADSLSIALTKNILDKLAIKTTLNNSNPSEKSLPNHTIQVSKIVIYSIGASVLFLIMVIGYLLYKNHKTT